MAVFDSKIFNPTVFEKYLQRVPNLKRNELIKSGAVQRVTKYKNKMIDQDGGNYIIEPIKGLLDGDVINYDGETNITATSRKTFMQGKVAIGRAKAWTEKDFSQELTGVDWIKTVAGEVGEYYQGIDQDDLLAVLKGIFSMTDTGAGSVAFLQNHVINLSQEQNNTFGATTLNTAMQKAGGDNKAIFQIAFMHSLVATNLENLQLLDYLKYTDADGITRDLGIGTLNGRIVIIDDEMPIENGYYAATSSTEGALEVVASGASTGEINLADVKKGDFYPDGVKAGDYVVASGAEYTTYVLGKGAFEFEDLGARVPSEMDRDPATNGGEDTLYTRQRKIYVPKWISFTKASMSTASPTKAELANGANWEVVNSGEATVGNRTYVNHKGIPMLKIVTKG